MVAKKNYRKLEASYLTKESVYQLAESVAKQLRYVPPDDLRPIVAKLGGKLVYRDFWELEASDSGSTIIHGPENFEIILPRHTSLERDRFTIAHELGHYVLHYLWPARTHRDYNPAYAARYGSDRAEWEANWFAAAFLMPAGLFKSTVNSLRGKDGKVSVPLLASRFGVSNIAAKVRAQALGLQI